MAAAMTSPMTTWQPQHHPHSLSWPDNGMGYQPQHMMPAYGAPMNTPVSHAPPGHTPIQRTSSVQPGQSAPWTSEEDSQLMDAKSHGLGWNEIMKQYFPNKSGNACRKRHERLMVKLRTTDWDEARIRRVIAEYNTPGFREAFWRMLSDRVNEKWEDVERVCFQQGLKGLRTNRPHHSRGQSRASSGPRGSNSEYEHGSPDDDCKDDSGLDLTIGSRRTSLMVHSGASTLDHILHQPSNGYGYH